MKYVPVEPRIIIIRWNGTNISKYRANIYREKYLGKIDLKITPREVSHKEYDNQKKNKTRKKYRWRLRMKK